MREISMGQSKEQLQVMIKITAPEGSNEKAIETLQPLLGSIRSRDGCLGCHLYQDEGNPDEVVLFEEWRDEASFAEHVSSKDYRFILEWMELSIKKPTVTVCRGPNHNGIEFIKRVKKKN